MARLKTNIAMTSVRTKGIGLEIFLPFKSTHHSVSGAFDDLVDEFIRERSSQFGFILDDFAAFDDLIDLGSDDFNVFDDLVLELRQFSFEQSFGTRMIRLLTHSYSSSRKWVQKSSVLSSITFTLPKCFPSKSLQ